MTSDESAARSNSLQAIINDVVTRRAAGETVSDQSIIDANPQLMPDLANRLDSLHDTMLSQQATRTFWPGLHVRCPQCSSPVECEANASLSALLCPSCGSQFSLVDDSNRTYQVRRDETIGHFQLLDKVGAGAFGSVWSARDTELDRHVALKIPRKGQMSPEDCELFVREARAAAQLKHPHIVSVLEVGRHEDRIYIVSEFVQGLDLADWLSGDRATVRETADLVATVAGALQHAHEHGVIHRDLKPSNIMLDTDGEPHLMDFGLAKRESGEMTITVDGKLLGTPAYMSPEQARGQGHNADARSDVYSLGVILFEMLTGERPFRGSTRMVLHQVLIEDAPSLRKLNSLIPRDLETVCLKCLEKAPVDRYQSAGELRLDLLRFLRGEPVEARPISGITRVWRWCKRKPLVSTLAALLLITVLSGLTGVTLLWQRAAGNAVLAQRAANKANSYAASANRHLYKSLVREARATRLARRSDYRTQAWQRLNEALALNIPDADLLELRCEAVACLGDHVGREPLLINDSTSTITAIAEASHDELFAVGEESGRVTIRNANNGGIDSQFNVPGAVHSLRFCGDVNGQNSTELVVVHDQEGGLAARSWKYRSGGDWVVDEDAISNDAVAVAVSAFGRVCAIGKKRRHVLLQSLEDNSVLRRMRSRGAIESVALSNDGTLLAVIFDSFDAASEDEARWGIQIWDLTSDENISTVLYPKLDILQQVAFSPSGRYLACACSNGLAVYESFRDPPLSFKQGDNISSVSFIGDDGLVAYSSGQQNLLKVWNAVTNNEVARLDSPGLGAIVTYVESNQMLIASEGQSLSLHSIADDSRKMTVFGHRMGVPGIAYSPDGKMLASTSKDQTVKLWETNGGQYLRSLAKLSAAGQSLAFSPDGRLVATGDLSIGVKIWDSESGRELWSPSSDRERMTFTVTFSPNGKYLAACGPKGIQLWRCRCTSASDANISVAMEEIGAEIKVNEVYDVCFSPDSTMLAWAEFVEPSVGARVNAWDIVNATLLTVPSHQLSGRGKQSLAFLPETSCLVFVTADQTIVGWNLASANETFSFSLTGSGAGEIRTSNHMSLDPSGRFLALESADRIAVEIWDIKAEERLVTLPADSGVIWRLAWSPDGNEIGIAGSDGPITVWNLPAVREELAKIGLEWQR